METNIFAAVTTAIDSAVLTMGSANAYWVDLYVPYLTAAAAAVEFDGADFTFKYTVDGTNYKAVPGMTVADDETGYKGKFLVWGSKLKFTSANNAGTASTVTPTVRFKAASMAETRDFTNPVAGVLTADSGSEVFNFGRAPDMLLLDAEASTWDSVDLIIQGEAAKDMWVDLDGTHATVNDQYLVFNNPGKLTSFRWEWSAGGLSAAGFTAKVIGLTNRGDGSIMKEANVLGTATEAFTDSTGGTPDTAAPILVDCTASYSQSAVENNFSTISTHYNRVQSDLARVVDTLTANGMLPGR